MTSARYSALLEDLHVAVRENRREMLARGVQRLHDNAPANTAHFTLTTAHRQNIEILPHPPYSPDLSPCDFYLFQNLTKYLRGTKFSEDDDVIDAC